MKIYEMNYSTITGRECRASILHESEKGALETALATLAAEGIKVVSAETPYYVGNAALYEKPPRVLRLDTN